MVPFMDVIFSRSCNSFQTFDVSPDLARKTAELAQIQITDEEVRRTVVLDTLRLVSCRSRVLGAICSPHVGCI